MRNKANGTRRESSGRAMEILKVLQDQNSVLNLEKYLGSISSDTVNEAATRATATTDLPINPNRPALAARVTLKNTNMCV
jgi:hypothetical protein